MAISITTQPTTDTLCSTLIPLKLSVTEATADTTNIVATCYYTNQTTSVETQISGKFRMAPSLTNADNFNFDSSEIFNGLTKYTLADYPNNIDLGSNVGTTNSLQTWADVATFKVRVKFQREYLDATTGLIVLDATFTDSNYFYIHEGSPEKNWILNVVESNGQSDSVFDYFNFQSQIKKNRFFTNYPITKLSDGTIKSNVNIHENESYMLAFVAPPTSFCGYKFTIETYSGNFTTLLNTHDLAVTESDNLQTVLVGFRDLYNGFAPNAAEGNVSGSEFINVNSYKVIPMTGNTLASPCTYVIGGTEFHFRVNRGCLLNSGYLRFCFKNMLGGYDMVSSNGEYIVKENNTFQSFEQTLGFDNWHSPMNFGNSNWANSNVEKYTVTTESLTPKNATHFAEMFSSTQVYLRVNNNSNNKVFSSSLNNAAAAQPYVFYPIVLEGGVNSISKTSDNYSKLNFSFNMAVNQSNPRY